MKVSELCLGTMTFGEEFGFGAPEAECRAVFDAFITAGGNFVDTADIYTAGTSERMLGDFMATERDQLVLATKYSLSTSAADPNAGGSHRKNLVHSLEASLRRLKTDCIDLYWVHGWDGSTDMAEVMRALDDQVRAGKIMHVGISNAPAWVIAEANTIATERGWTPFTAMQLHYNLIERSIERDHFALARAHNMAILPWSPLASGLLTGKYDRGADDDGAAARLRDTPRGGPILKERNLEVAEAVSKLAKKVGCTTAQLALAWTMRRTDACVVPILGTRTLKQLEDNLGALNVGAGDALLEELDALTALTPEYPNSFYLTDFFRTMMYGETWEQIEIDRPWGINQER